MSTLMKISLLCVISFLYACEPTTISEPQYEASQEAPKPKVWPYNSNVGEVEATSEVPEMLRSNYWVVFDDSGSMDSDTCDSSNKTRLEAAREATRAFYRLIPEDANFGLMVINNTRTPIVPLSVKGKQVGVLEKIDEIDTDGGTPLNAATKNAFETLTSQGLRQGGYGEYNVVIITDGASGDGDISDNIDFMIDKTDITVHAIGLCSDDNRALNQSGRTFYTSARNTAELEKGFEAVLAETDDSFDPNETF